MRGGVIIAIAEESAAGALRAPCVNWSVGVTVLAALSLIERMTLEDAVFEHRTTKS